MIASKFTIRFWSLGSDFRGAQFSSTAILLGIGFALYVKIARENANKFHIKEVLTE